MNLSKIACSDVCQRCGLCCRSYSEYVDVETAKRLVMLDTDRIEVKEIKTKNGTFFRVEYKFRCKKLRIDPVDGKFFCEIHGSKDMVRPLFCRTFPDNLPLELMEVEKSFCPLIKKFLEGKNSILK